MTFGLYFQLDERRGSGHRPDFVAKCIQYLVSSKFLPFLSFLIFPFALYIHKTLFEGDSKAALLKSAQQQLSIIYSDSIIQKLNLLIEMQAQNLSVSGMSIFVSMVYSAAMLALLLFAIGMRAASFISINDFSNAILVRYRSKLSLVQMSIALAFVIGLSSSVFGSKIYDLLKTYSMI